jgi:hypothetical protein
MIEDKQPSRPAREQLPGGDEERAVSYETVKNDTTKGSNWQ